jgi:hypothetical protein
MKKGLLDSLTDDLDEVCIETLGDPIIYKTAASAAKTIYGFVDHTDKELGFNGVQINNQDIQIEVRKVDVPVISETDLITLPQLGKSFHPRGDARNSRDGRMVHISLQRARA